MIAGWGVKYFIHDFFSETVSWIKKKLDGKQVPKVFSQVCFILGRSISFLSIPFLFFFKENTCTCIFKHSVCAPQLSYNRKKQKLAVHETDPKIAG